MARTQVGATAALRTDASLYGTPTVSLHVRVRRIAAVTGSNPQFLQFRNGSNNVHALYLRTSSSLNNWAQFTYDGTTFKDAISATTVLNQWVSIVIHIYSGHNVDMYVNNGSYAGAAGLTMSDPNEILIPVGSLFELCDIAIWDGYIGSDDKLALSKGVSPLRVDADKLKHYWPLIGRENNDIVGGYSLHTGDHPFVPSPKSILHSAQILQFPPTAAAAETLIPGTHAGAPYGYLPYSGSVGTTVTIGGTTYQLSGVLAGIATLGLSASSTKSTQGSIDSVASVLGDLVKLASISGSADSISSYVGNIVLEAKIASLLQATSSLVGESSASENLVGSVDSANTLTGALDYAASIAGALSAQSLLEGNLTSAALTSLAGIIQGQSTIASPEAKAIAALAASIDGVSSLSAEAQLTQLLGGLIAAQSLLEGNLTTTATVTLALAGEIAGLSTLSGDLLRAVRLALQGEIASNSTLSGDILKAQGLTGSVDSLVTINDAGSSISVSLLGSINGTATFTEAGTSLILDLSGSLDGVSTLTGILANVLLEHGLEITSIQVRSPFDFKELTVDPALSIKKIDLH